MLGVVTRDAVDFCMAALPCGRQSSLKRLTTCQEVGLQCKGFTVLQVPRKGRGKRKRAQSAANHLPNGLSWPHVSLL